MNEHPPRAPAYFSRVGSTHGWAMLQHLVDIRQAGVGREATGHKSVFWGLWLLLFTWLKSGNESKVWAMSGNGGTDLGSMSTDKRQQRDMLAHCEWVNDHGSQFVSHLNSGLPELRQKGHHPVISCGNSSSKSTKGDGLTDKEKDAGGHALCWGTKAGCGEAQQRPLKH